MRLRLVLPLIILVLAVPPARAQRLDSARTRTITLREALGLVTTQNLSLRRAETAERQQRIALETARASRLPTLSVDGGASQSYGRSVFETQVRSETNEAASLNVQSSVSLYDAGVARVQARQARIGIEGAQRQRDRIAQTLVFNVATNYVTVLSRGENVRLQRQALADQREQLARVEGLIAGGVRPEADRYAQLAEVAQAELNVATAERDALVSDGQLVELLQLDPLGTYRFVIPELPTISAGADVAPAYDLAALLTQAYTARPDLRAQQADIRSAEQGVRLARLGTRPQVGASFGYGTSWASSYQRPIFGPDGQVTGVQDAPLFTQLNDRRGGQLSLSVQLPVFDRRQTALSTQRARVALDDARLALDEQRQTVATQVRQAVLDARAAEAQVRAATVQVDAARRALTAAEDRYRFGTATIYDAAQARAALLSAESSLLQARTTLLLQDQIIRYYTGTLDPASLPLGE